MRLLKWPILMANIFLIAPLFSVNMVASADSGVLSSLTFNRPERPPGRGAPGYTTGGGSRGECLTSNVVELQALIPSEQETEVLPTGDEIDGATHVWGHTVSASPTLWFSISQPLTNAVLNVRLESTDRAERFTHTALLPDASGIFAVPLPAEALENNQERYRWRAYVQVDCGAAPPERLSVSGAIYRVALSDELTTQLSTQTLQEKAVLYAREGIWFEALEILMQLYQASPNDETVLGALEQLLAAESINLPEITIIDLVEETSK